MITKENGIISWDLTDFVEYHVTGVDRWGKRFRCMRYEQWCWANRVNIYRGTKWGVLPSGRRVKIQEVWN
jgi:hypothetical protein